MGCGNSKHAAPAVDNTAVLSRKKSGSISKSLRDVDQSNHNVAEGTNDRSNPANNVDNGNKVAEVKETMVGQMKSDDGAKDLSDAEIIAGKIVGINTSNIGNGNAASGAVQKEKENANVVSNVSVANNDIEAKTKVVQEESEEGKDSNKIEEPIAVPVHQGDKKTQEATVIAEEKIVTEAKSDEKVESDSDTPSAEITKEDAVAGDVKVDDAEVEEQPKEEPAKEDADAKEEIKEEQTNETDVTASTTETQEKPESSSPVNI